MSKDEFDQDSTLVSKSQRKRDSLAVQKLGEQLTQLKPQQLAQIPLNDDLRSAIEELSHIHHREGRRRHLQFIGKLMRNADHEAIEEAYSVLQNQGRQQIQEQHLAERWRDRLLGDDPQALQEFIDQQNPEDIQHLRQLVRQAQREQQQQKPPAAARKLFRYLRETLGQG